jgi:methionine aminotransferase
VPLDPVDFSVDGQRVRDAVTPRTRMLMINSPHNPSGAMLEAEDMEELAAILRGTDIVLLSDEVYEHIVFDGEPHQSLARRPELAERSFVISSFAKTFHATGWKVGYCCAPPALTEELRRVHQFVVFAVSTPVQHAVARYLRDPAVYETLPGWSTPTKGVTRFEQLPAEAQRYIRRLEDTSGVACAIISTGSDRHETIVRSDSVVAGWLD